jgi:hypothetical protein
MAQEFINRPMKKIRGKVHELLSKHSVENPELVNAKRERFLARLKSQFGYTNDKAVDELERLLKQFYGINKNLSTHRARPNSKPPQAE